jgi:hypothetical protein
MTMEFQVSMRNGRGRGQLLAAIVKNSLIHSTGSSAGRLLILAFAVYWVVVASSEAHQYHHCLLFVLFYSIERIIAELDYTRRTTD